MTQSFTQHAICRMGQRGISKTDIDLIKIIGTEVEGGYLVRKKDLQEAERELRRLQDQLHRLAGKRAVIADNCVVTAYHARPAKQRKLLLAARRRASGDF